jgi:DNA-directed RNA polymerase beta subunit
MASGNENMSKEDDHDERQNNSFSDSNELFENIFRQAISETEKPKAGKPNVEQNRRAVTMRAKTQSQSERKASASVDKPVRQLLSSLKNPDRSL